MTIRFLVVSMLAALIATPTVFAKEADRWLVLNDLTLIDGTGAPPRVVAALVARNGTIVSIGATGAQPAPFDEVTTLALDGAVVMPGLIDSHVHLSGFPGDRDSLPAKMANALRGGITSVRDMAGDARVLADVKRAVVRGELPGLTICYAALFGGPSMFGDPRVQPASAGYPPGTAPWAQGITNATDLPLAIAAARGTGANGIKLYGNLDAALVAAISAEAHRQDLAVWAHATVFPARPGDLLDAGVDVLSHAPYLIWEAVDDVPADYGARREGPYDDIPPDHEKIRALLKRMAQSQTLLDTTLLIYRDAITMAEGAGEGAWAKKAFAWGTAVTGLAYELGVPLAAGTDRFRQDEWSLPDLHEEMAILVSASGLTALDAITAATRNAARAAGIADTHGMLMTGRAADMLVLGANPLDDIRATRDIRVVIKNGRIVHSP